MRVGVIGGGTMGIGIAHRVAASGGTAYIVDVDEATARTAADTVIGTLLVARDRGKLSESAASDAVRHVVPAASIEALPHGLDAIIEAIIEDVDLKRSVLAAAEGRSPEVLASNTSSISIDQLSEGLEHPNRFAGMHFFNPVWAISLVEVIRGSATDPSILDRIAEIVEGLGMEQAVINDSAGFATSRLGVLVGIEAIRMVEEGVAAPADIDTAMRLGYRHPMGPLMLGDLVGLDVRLKIAQHLASVYGSRFEAPQLLIDMVADNRLGKKSGLGFYDWSSGSPVVVQEG